jgi:hypothetical protein
MVGRRKEELKLVQARYGDIEIGTQLEWLVINHWPLPNGWNKQETAVLVFIPPGYPVTPPDNFYADNDLRLANGNLPGNASPGQRSHLDKQWLQFSYHVERGDWHPHADLLQGHNLLTFLNGVEKRLKEAI